MSELNEGGLYSAIKKAPKVQYNEPVFKNKRQASDYYGKIDDVNRKAYDQEAEPVAPEGFGESRYDKDVTDVRSLNNMENFRAKQQGTTAAFLNGLISRGLSVAPKFVAGIGYVGGALNALSSEIMYPDVDNFSKIYDNAIANGANEIDERLKEALPVYADDQYSQGKTLIDQMGTSKFWFDDLFDGIAYAASAFGGAGLVGTGLKVTGMAGKIAAGSEALISSPNMLSKIAGKGLKELPDALVATYNTISEAGAEAHQINKEVYNTLIDRDVDPKLAKQKAADAARHTFNANMGALALSNYVQAKFFAGFRAKPAMKDMRKSFLKGEVSQKDFSYIKDISKKVGTGIVSEGFWEENVQHAIQQYETRMADPKNTEDYSPIANYAQGMIDNLSDVQGQKAIMLGAIIGGGMGAGSAFSQTRKQKSALNEVEKYFQGPALESIKSALQNMEAEKTSITDDAGNIDPDKFSEMFYRKMNDKGLFNEATVAALNNDENHMLFNNTMAIGRAFNTYVKTFGDVDLAVDALKDKFSKVIKPEDQEAITKTLSDKEGLLEKLAEAYEGVENDYFDMSTTSEPLALKMVKNAMFYNKMKNVALQEMLDTQEMTSEQRESMESVIADNNLRYKELSSKATRNKILASYKEQGKVYDKSIKDTKANIDEIANKETITKEDRTESNVNKYKRDEYIGIEGMQPIHEFSVNEMFNSNELGAKHQSQFELGQIANKRAETFNAYSNILKGVQESKSNFELQQHQEELDKINKQSLPYGHDASTAALIDDINKEISDRKQMAKEGLNDVEKYNKTAEDPLHESMKNFINDQSIFADTEGVETDEHYFAQEDMDALISTAAVLGDQNVAEALFNARQIKEDGELLFHTMDIINAVKKSKNPLDYTKPISDNYQKSIEEMSKLDVKPQDKITAEVEKLSDGQLQKKAADNFLSKATKQVLSVFKNNPDNFSDVNSVNNAERKLKEIKDFYNSEEGKERSIRDEVIKDIEDLEKQIADAKTVAIKNSQNRDLSDEKSVETRNQASLRFVHEKSMSKVIRSIIGDYLFGKFKKKLQDPKTRNSLVLIDYLVNILKTKNKETTTKSLEDMLKVSQDKFESQVNDVLDDVEDGVFEGTVQRTNNKGESEEIVIYPYNESPSRVFNLIVDSLVSKGLIDNESSYPIDDFMVDRDPAKLLNALESGAELNIEGISKEDFLTILEAHLDSLSVSDLYNNYKSDLNIKDQIEAEKQLAKSLGKYPSQQQIMSLRQLMVWFKTLLAPEDRLSYREFVYLRGLAGTGKTDIILKFVAKSLGLEDKNIIATGANFNSTETVNNSLGLENKKPVDELKAEDFNGNIKLLIVDEVGSMSEERLESLRSLVYNINVARAKNNAELLRVLVAGDPSQITPGGEKTAPINRLNPQTPNKSLIGDIIPLTIPFRSDQSGINQMASAFHMNKRKVDDLTLSHKGNVGNDLTGTYSFDNQNQMINHIDKTKSNGKSKVIIVHSVDDKNKYSSTGLDVLTYHEAQGMTIGEAYIDLNPNRFDSVEEYNRAMYTMTTRGVDLVTVLNHDASFDNSLSDEATRDATEAMISYRKESAKKFSDNRKEELSILDNVKSTKKESTSNKETKKEGQTSEQKTKSEDISKSIMDAFGISKDKAEAASAILSSIQSWISDRVGKVVDVKFSKDVSNIDLNDPNVKKQFIQIRRYGDDYVAKISDTELAIIDDLSKKKYHKAIQMYEDGWNNYKIYAKTGFIVNPNGQAYLYSPLINAENPFQDKEAIQKVLDNKKIKRLKLGKIMNINESTFKTVVDMGGLMDTTVTFDYKPDLVHSALFEVVKGSRNGIIRINTAKVHDLNHAATVIVHETQHAIQHFNKSLTKAQIKHNEDIIVSIVRSVEQYRGLGYDDALKMGYDLQYTEKKLTDVSNQFIQDSIYAINADEVEARMAQTLFETGQLLTDYHETKVVYQSVDEQAYGAMIMDKAKMESMIYAFEKGDIHTIVHEFGHIIEEFLNNDEVDTILNWYNSTEKKTPDTDVWNTDVSETFSTGLETYLQEGIAPNPEIQSIFDKVKVWITELYQGVVNKYKIPLNDDMRALYGSILQTEVSTPEKVESVVEKPAEANEDIVVDEQIDQDDDGSNIDIEDDGKKYTPPTIPEFEDVEITENDDVVIEDDGKLFTEDGMLKVQYPSNKNIQTVKPGDEVTILRTKNNVSVYKVSRGKNTYTYERIGILHLENDNIETLFGDKYEDATQIADKEFLTLDYDEAVDADRTLGKAIVVDNSRVTFSYSREVENSLADVLNMYDQFITDKGYSDYYISNVQYKIYTYKDIDAMLASKRPATRSFMPKPGIPYMFVKASAPNKKSFTHFVELERKAIPKDDETYMKPIAAFNKSLKAIESLGIFGKAGGYIYSSKVSNKVDENTSKLNLISKYIANNLFEHDLSNEKDLSHLVNIRNQFTEEDVTNIKKILTDSSLSYEGITVESLNDNKENLFNITDGAFGMSYDKKTFNNIKYFKEYMESKNYEDVTKETYVQDNIILNKADNNESVYYHEGLFYHYKEKNKGSVSIYEEGFEKAHGASKYDFKYLKEWGVKDTNGRIKKLMTSIAMSNNIIDGSSVRQVMRGEGNRRLFNSRPLLSPIDLTKSVKDNKRLIAEFKDQILTPVLDKLNKGELALKDQEHADNIESYKHVSNNIEKGELVEAALDMLKNGYIEQSVVDNFLNNEVGRNEGSRMLDKVVNSGEVRYPIDKKEYEKDTNYNSGDDIDTSEESKMLNSNLSSMNRTNLVIDMVKPKEDKAEKPAETPAQKTSSLMDGFGGVKLASVKDDKDPNSIYVKPSELGKKISFNQAVKDIKKIVPGLKETDIRVLEKATEAAFRSAGRYGMYSDGIIYLIRNEDGTVYKNIARHEAFHAIFNSVTNNKLRKGIKEALLNEDPNIKITDNIHLEEILARRFQTWRSNERSVPQIISDVFKKIMNILSFNHLYKPTLDNYFSGINKGSYGKNVGDFNGNRNAKAAIHSVREDIEDYDKATDTYIEISEFIKNSYLKISEMPQADIMNRYEIAYVTKNLIRQSADELKAQLTKMGEDMEGTNADISAYRDLHNQYTLREMSNKHFIKVLKDIYPSIDLSRVFKILENDATAVQERIELIESGIIDDDNSSHDNTDAFEEANTEAKEYEDNSITEYIIESDAVNRLAQMSSSVKDFIASITYRMNDKDNVMSQKDGFFSLLNILNIYKPDIQDKSLIEQIKDNKDLLNANPKTLAVIDAINDAYGLAVSKTYRDANGKQREFGGFIQALDTDLIAVSKNRQDGKMLPIDLSDRETFIAVSRVNKGKVLLTSDLYEHAVNVFFTNNKIERTPDTELEYSMDYNGLVKLNKVYKAQNTIREMGSLVGSLKKDELIYTNIEKDFGNYKIEMRNSKGIDAVKQFRSMIITKLSKAINEGSYNANKAAAVKILNSKSPDHIKLHDMFSLFDIRHNIDEIPEGPALSSALNAFKEKLFNSQFIQDAVNSRNKAQGEENDNQANISKVVNESIGGALNMLADALVQFKGFEGQQFVKSTDGKKRYLWNASDFGFETLDSVQRMSQSLNDNLNSVKDKLVDLVLPKHLTGKFYRNNIFVNGLSTLYRVVTNESTADGLYRTDYKDEKGSDFFTREYSSWFLSSLKKGVLSNRDKLTYIQRLYVISNKPKAVAVEVEHLTGDQIKKGYLDVMLQHLNKSSGNLMINNASLAKAIQYIDPSIVTDAKGSGNYNVALTEEFIKENGQKVVDYLYNTVFKEEAEKAATAMINSGFKLDTSLFKDDKLVDRIVDKTVYEDFDKNEIYKTRKINNDGKLVTETRKFDKTDENGNKITVEEDVVSNKEFRFRETMKMVKKRGGISSRRLLDPKFLAPYLHSFIANDTLQSFSATQLVAGDNTYFKTANKTTKRLSGVFAPGLAPFVHDVFGSKEKFRAVVANDLQGFTSTSGKAKDENLTGEEADRKTLEDLFLELGIKGKKLKRLNEIYNNDTYDYTDGQGLMTPERLRDLQRGFGESYGLGNVHKPIYYGIDEETAEPIMFKYSSFVITDYVADEFPQLKTLREKMRKADVGELLFVSGVKVGNETTQPVNARDLIDGKAEGISNDNVHTLNNASYRLQFNPKHTAPSDTLNPGQLSYFVNVNESDAKQASDIYNGLRYFIQKRTDKMRDKLNSKGRDLLNVALGFLEGPGNEFEYDTVNDIYDENKALKPFNMPSVIKKFYTSLGSGMSNDILKIKYPGGKFVLVSDYGFNNPTTGKALEVKEDESGNKYYAEVLLNRDFALRQLGKDRVAEIEKGIKDKTGLKDFFIGPDLMSFRIPSSELHSAMPLKIVGFTEDNSYNTIVAPNKIVPLHGSDYDVDALYVLSRSVDKQGVPIGYSMVDGKYKFNYIDIDNNTTYEEIEERYRSLLTKDIGGSAANVEDYVKNMILQSFLDVVTDRKNSYRMMKPITVGFIHDFKNMLNSKGITTSDLENDLSSVLFSQKTHASSFDGLAGTGVIANAIKSLVFMSKASKGNKPSKLKFPKEIKEDKNRKQDNPPDMNIYYEENGTEKQVTGLVNTESLWEVLDGFLNAATDNVNEQLLPYFNLTSNTLKHFIAMVGTGIDWKTAGLLMKQPVVEKFSTLKHGNYMNTANDIKYLLDINDSLYNHYKGTKALSYDSMLNDLKDYKNIDYLINKKESGVKLSDSEVAYVERQAEYLQIFSKFGVIGNGISSMSTYLNILSEQKTTESEHDFIMEKRSSVLSSDYIFDIENLYSSNPHLKAYDEAFMLFDEKKSELMFRYSSKIKKDVKRLFNTINDRLKLTSDKKTENEKKLDLFMSLIATSVEGYDISGPMADDLQYSNKDGKKLTYTGINAFSKRTEMIVNALKDNDQISKDKHLYEFISRISVGYDVGAGRNRVNYFSDSAMDFAEKMNVKKGFDKLSMYKAVYKDNSYRILEKQGEDLAHNESDIQTILIQYAVLDNGLTFSNNNYSKYIPGKYLRDYYQKYEAMMENMQVKGIGKYTDYAKVLIAIGTLGNDVGNTFNGKLLKDGDSYFGTTSYSKLLDSKNEEIEKSDLFYDFIVEKENNKEGPAIITSIYQEKVEDATKQGREGSSKRKYVSIKVDSGVNTDYYKTISSSTEISPLIAMNNNTIDQFYFAKYAVRPDIRSALTKEIKKEITVGKNVIDRYNKAKIGEYVNVTTFSDIANASPVVYEIVKENKEDYTLVKANDGRSTSIHLLKSLEKEMKISLDALPSIKGSRITFREAVNTVYDNIINPKFNVDPENEIVKGIATSLGKAYSGLTTKAINKELGIETNTEDNKDAQQEVVDTNEEKTIDIKPMDIDIENVQSEMIKC